jgi:phospholipid transport system transporter-binding protein
MYQPSIPLTMLSARTALEEGLRVIESGETSIDLAEVSGVDSAALAILLVWQRSAKARGTELNLSNASSTLLSLATLYGVSDLLKFSSGDSGEVGSQRH